MLLAIRWVLLVWAVVVSASNAIAAPSSVAAWIRDGARPSENLGATVTTAGDFNCDGVADLAIGVPNADSFPDGTPSWTNGGWVGVWFGGATLPPQPTALPDWFVFGGTPSARKSDAEMGKAVAAGDVNRDGCDDLIASAPGLNIWDGVNRVNVYFGHPTGPSTSPDWSRTQGGFGFRFGASVASGDVNGDGTADIIVGAPEANLGGQSLEGAVLVWLGSQFIASTPSGDASDADWIAQSNQSGATLGEVVASAGDVDGDGDDEVLAGAPKWDGTAGGPVVDEGIALMWSGSPVFESTADGTPLNASWSMQLGIAGAHVGATVAGAGDVDGDGFADVLVGAPDYNNPSVLGSNEGIVLVTRGLSSGPFSDLFDWYHSGQQSLGRLGASLSTAGDTNGDGLADYLLGEPGAFRAHLFLGRSVWPGANPVSDVIYNEVVFGFAKAVGTAGDWNADGFSDVVIGAPEVTFDNGRVYVYLGRGETLASAPIFTAQTAQPGATLGVGVGFAGDINHDGYTDLVAGAPNYESEAPQADEGRIFVYYGGPCGPACAPFFESIFPGDREGNQAGAQLGFSVSGAGDVNGDGFADVIAGAPFWDGFEACPPPLFLCPVPDAGVAHLYLGGPGGLAFTQSTSFNGNLQAGAQFGYSVASAGDVNGDGLGDVIVGAPFASSGLANEGKAFLYLGSASGLVASGWSQAGGQANARFGTDVAGAGDVNADGFSDVIIGADGYNGTGAAFVYLGRPISAAFPFGLSTTPVQILLGTQSGSSFGLSVDTAGDVNRDGFADVVVGAPTYLDDPDFGPQIGQALVYHGSLNGPNATPNSIFYGEYSIFGPTRFGSGVAGAGDVNGDGFGDLIVGDQWQAGPAGFAQGKAYVYHGGASGLSTISARSFQDCPDDSCDFGLGVAGAGDLNGDGFSDVLIGAFKYRQVALNAGAVFVHLGNEDRGTPVRPLQALGFGGAARALLGITPDWFEVSADLKSPAGRSRAALQLEVKPLGQDFDGQGLVTSVFQDNGITSRDALNFLGAPGTAYHWRARVWSASPLFGRSKWVSLPGNAPRETDVRTVPEPGLVAGLVSGMAVLALLDRRRRGLGARLPPPGAARDPRLDLV